MQAAQANGSAGPQSATSGDAMDVNVSGKHMDVGDALRSRIVDELTAGVGRYFERGGEADVFVGKEGHSVCVDIVLRLANGQRLVARGLGGDAHSAFTTALVKVETRIRRYKRRLVAHKPHNGGGEGRAETAAYTVLRPSDDDDDDLVGDGEYGQDGSAGNGAPGAAIVAESQKEVKSLTVAGAVMELEITDASAVMFRNLAHGGLSVVYRRTDGDIGWIDPERTGAASGDAQKPADTAAKRPAQTQPRAAAGAH